MSPPGSAELFRPDRLLASNNGVFAVAITLLVVYAHLPAILPDSDDYALLQAPWGMRILLTLQKEAFPPT